VSDDLDSLFTAPPPEFIEARKRIVAALKDAGRKDEAKAIEKIPRPTLAVWTVNQIARRDPELIRHLGEITERLQAVTGPDYAAAAVEHRTALQELRERAGEVLADAGHEIAPSIVQRVIANLRAAAGAAETRVTLEQGRLARDVEEPEIASLFGTTPEAQETAENASEDASEDERGDATASKPGGAAANAGSGTTAAAGDRQADERARAKQIALAEREVKRRRGAEAAARKEVTRAEGAVSGAREKLALAEIRAASARAAAEAAAGALAQAEADLARTSGN